MIGLMEKSNATTNFILVFFLFIIFLIIHVFSISFRHTDWKKRS